jgi:hypothetical protein
VTVDYNIPVRVKSSAALNPEPITPLQSVYVQEYVDFIGNGKRFMVQSISVDRDIDGPEYSLRLVEMPPKLAWNSGEF